MDRFLQTKCHKHKQVGFGEVYQNGLAIYINYYYTHPPGYYATKLPRVFLLYLPQVRYVSVDE